MLQLACRGFCTRKFAHYWHEHLGICSHFFAVRAFRQRIFWSPRALTTVSARGLGGAGVDLDDLWLFTSHLRARVRNNNNYYKYNYNYKKQTTNNKQQTTNNKQQTTNNNHNNNSNNNNNQQPTTNNQQPTTNNQQPTTNNQQPTTNNQQPTTNNQQPTTNNQQPTTNNQQQDCLSQACPPFPCASPVIVSCSATQRATTARCLEA